jgi:hypothetical protein
MGYVSGQSTQGGYAISIGTFAGRSQQGSNAIAIGTLAGATGQRSNAIAIGWSAGNSTQNAFAISIGTSAGQFSQGSNAVAIGFNSGFSNQGSNAIAIGFLAGRTGQAANSICLNASGFVGTTPATFGFYATPVRTVAQGASGTLFPVLFNSTTTEFSYVGTNALNYVTSTGVLSATAFNTTSDRTTKTSIQELPLEYCRDLVKKIHPVQYAFKNDKGTKRFGFIAQEIEEVLDGEKLGLHYRDPEGNNPQAVGYQELIAPLVKIINDLMVRIEILEKR